MIQSILHIVLFAAICFGILYFTVAAGFIALERLRARRRSDVPAYRPPITVFKPLKGLDDQLEDNLRSFFELDYPEYELLFGVADTDDPAIDVVQKLRRVYPMVHARLVVDPGQIGLNPKVNNLHNMYPFARHDYFVISDSNVRVPRNYLSDLIAHMQSDDVGMVTSHIRGVGATTFGAAMENLHLNTFIADSVYAVGRLFGVPVTIGKSMLIRRETLESIGGFRAFAQYLLEDGLLGKAIDERGMTVLTTCLPVENVNATWTLTRFCSRHLRWATMRRHLNIGYYIAEILSNPTALALINFSVQRDPASLGLLLSVSAARIVLDMITGLLMRSESRWSHYLMVPVKDLVMFGLWLIPFFNRMVTWRGHRFRVRKLTRLEPVATEVAEADLTTG
ncbi:glycosyltransferase [candidate division GN15 bacterium]|nr:glycosyltransferase [candidate division GN15 bacterium]